ncbi:MAG TPA: hypothetical protein VF832_02320 [Longimicrobiales bacterium]
MKRVSWVLSTALLTLPFGLAAQSGETPGSRWTITVQAGIHADRLDRPERVDVQGAGGDMVSEAFSRPGEAPTVGLRATRWLTGHLGIDVGTALAHNSSWNGSWGQAEPTFRKLTLFSSLAPVWRVFAPGAEVQLQLGAGPTLVTHMGTGESLLTKGTDVGGMALADGSVRLSRKLQLVLGAQNYRFSSTFVDAGFRRPDGTYTYAARTVSRSEWVISTGIRIGL